MIAACDGTRQSSEVIAAARRLCDPDSALIVAHVSELLVGGGAAGLPAEIDEDDRVQRLALAVEQLQVEGVDARLELVNSLSRGTARAIVRLAAHRRADVVVVGTHGRSLVGELIHGHVADDLIAESDCPVLVCRLSHANPSPSVGLPV